MKSYGINRSAQVNSQEELHLEEFYNLGYTVIENAISESELAVLRAELDQVYWQQEASFGKEQLRAINEENLARIPLAYSEAYAQLAGRKDLLAYVEKILGNFFVLHLQNGIINMPQEEHHQSSWHRDLPYQNWTSSEPLACNLYYCLDEFNAETGATFILPFSHQFDRAPSASYMEKHAIQVSAPPGSVILFNSMLFHKAGYNRSASTIRRGVNHVYVKPILSQQIDMPALLNGKYSNDEHLAMLFGYKTMTSDSVDSYRMQRLHRNGNRS